MHTTNVQYNEKYFLVIFCASYSSSTGDSPANTGHVENAYLVEAHILPAKTAQQNALMEI